MKQRILNLLDKFLAERRKSDSDYAPVTDEDMRQLHDLIRLLIQAKWEKDCDGDVPVEYKLVNRHTHERMNFFPVPYDHIERGEQALRDTLYWAAANMTIAANRLDLAHRQIDAYWREQAEKSK